MNLVLGTCYHQSYVFAFYWIKYWGNFILFTPSVKRLPSYIKTTIIQLNIWNARFMPPNMAFICDIGRLGSEFFYGSLILLDYIIQTKIQLLKS
jgi:hypothetical protein